MSPGFDWRAELSRRPWWVTATLVFCVFMTAIYVPWDLFVKPVADDQDVWFGVLFTGAAAKVGGSLHWIVYSVLAYGLWTLRPWVWTVAALYVAQIAFAMVVWGALYAEGPAQFSGLVTGPLFGALAYAFWRQRPALESAS